jgi:hypothetical protein
MKRRLKALGLALLAVSAVCALTASAASAKQIHSNATSGTTYITGVQSGTNEFDLANKTPIKCTSAIFDASYAGTTASELTVTPTYTGCTAAGQKAEVKTTGCTYTITTPTEVSVDFFDAKAHLTCGAKSIEIIVPTAGCSVFIAAQTAGGEIDFTNVTSGSANQDDITLQWTVTALYTTVGGGICGLAGEGVLTGKVTVKAYNSALHTEQRDLAIF